MKEKRRMFVFAKNVYPFFYAGVALDSYAVYLYFGWWVLFFNFKKD